MADQLQHQPARPRRRRGEELEAALLDAAWQELAEAGFARLTMESVAARAKTGVAVLYRRWPRKSDLVFAAFKRYGQVHPVTDPDTGSLRGDLLRLLRDFSTERSSFMAVVIATFSGLLADSGITPAQMRLQILGERPQPPEIYRRAHERGEIDLEQIPPDVLTMPFDLLRHDVLMTLKPVPPERIASIVDDLFLPLATASLLPRAAAKPPAAGRGSGSLTR